MHRLIYISSATRLPQDKDLEAILAVSRRNNMRDGVTGMLVYHDGAFLQVLEGEQDVLERCYARIIRDPRHTRCIKMLFHATPSRMFADWKMAFRTYGGLQSIQQKQVTDIYAFARTLKAGEIEGHPAVNAVIMAFMSGFREFRMAG